VGVRLGEACGAVLAGDLVPSGVEKDVWPYQCPDSAFFLIHARVTPKPTE
jgi:hypothetical protein